MGTRPSLFLYKDLSDTEHLRDFSQFIGIIHADSANVEQPRGDNGYGAKRINRHRQSRFLLAVFIPQAQHRETTDAHEEIEIHAVSLQQIRRPMHIGCGDDYHGYEQAE